MVNELVDQKRTKHLQEPSLKEITAFLRLQFPGAENYGGAFLKTMQKQRWKDRNGQPIAHWKAAAKAYASAAEMNARGVGAAR